MKQIIECVPNFSEGRNPQIINQIAQAIHAVSEVKLLHIDVGHDAHRTVMTFAGPPQAVVEAAFQAMKVASQLIDMSQHQGEHPRIGATDVCPLVPIAGISMEEVIQLAHQLAKRVSRELGIPVYCYGEACLQAHKCKLEACRRGEYEQIEAKFANELWKPDFGAAVWNKKSGVSVIGARKFLIAYNATLSTEDVSLAQQMAQSIRESGYRAASGERVPGKFKTVKAIGWHMPEYKAAQVSMNLTDFSMVGMHTVVEELRRQAQHYGCRLVGSELIGLVPLQAMIDAGEHYAAQEGKADLSQAALLALACQHLMLDFHQTFIAEERIVEYALEARL